MIEVISACNNGELENRYLRNGHKIAYGLTSSSCSSNKACECKQMLSFFKLLTKLVPLHVH